MVCGCSERNDSLSYVSVRGAGAQENSYLLFCEGQCCAGPRIGGPVKYMRNKFHHGLALIAAASVTVDSLREAL